MFIDWHRLSPIAENARFNRYVTAGVSLSCDMRRSLARSIWHASTFPDAPGHVLSLVPPSALRMQHDVISRLL
jgi:hypothetical protein